MNLPNSLTLLGECREMAFPSFYFFAGKRLARHKIKTVQVRGIDDCELLCYHEPNCVSINLEAIADDKGENKCELNNSTHREHDKDLVDAPSYFYRGAKNACGYPTLCQHGGTCQSGFTDKGYRCICPSGITGEFCENSEADEYALLFPRKGVEDYVIVDSMPSLSALTACFWMRSNDTENAGTSLSYAVNDQHNELSFLDYKFFYLYVGGHYRRTQVTANDGMWHHICATWENTTGAWQFYKDGRVANHGQGLKKGHVIRDGGSLVLGQDQDSVGGGFKGDQSFIGELTGVNIWNRVLDDKGIAILSESCLAGEGDVFKWSYFKNHTRGGVQLIDPSCAA